MNPDLRFRRLLLVVLLIAGLLIGRGLFHKRAPVVNSPADFTEQIDGFNGQRTR